jgi:hypothetical protein
VEKMEKFIAILEKITLTIRAVAHVGVSASGGAGFVCAAHVARWATAAETAAARARPGTTGLSTRRMCP